MKRRNNKETVEKERIVECLVGGEKEKENSQCGGKRGKKWEWWRKKVKMGADEEEEEEEA